MSKHPTSDVTRPRKQEAIMARKNARTLVKLVSTESNHLYYTQKNKQNDQQRIELNKFDPVVGRHVLYREAN